jgi:hypothetical protein
LHSEAGRERAFGAEDYPGLHANVSNGGGLFRLYTLSR